MPFGYPVMLEVAGRRAVVIGDLAVREGKVEVLVAAGADDLVVVARGPERRLDRLAGLDGVVVRRRAWRPGDLDDAFLVVASHDDPDERAAIAREARDRGALVNVMDDVPHCDWAAPAVVRRGDLVLAVGTGGASPAIARRVREHLEAEYGEDWGDLLRVVADVRDEVRMQISDPKERAARWRAVFIPGPEVLAKGADELRIRLLEGLGLRP